MLLKIHLEWIEMQDNSIKYWCTWVLDKSHASCLCYLSR